MTVNSPTMALAVGHDGLWAAGIGGVARFTEQTGWQPQLAGLTLVGVASLAYAGGWLLAGGRGGIARSKDGGRAWQSTEIEGEPGPITALAPSPNFAQDTTVLAATFDSGILRSRDAGAAWAPATFGLQSFEITALAWGNDETVFAASSDGLYRSPNAGRAWQPCPGTERAPFAALTIRSDGTILAAVELGGLVRSQDGGQSWTRWGDLPPDIRITALYDTGRVLLMGTVSHGLLRSDDGGRVWQPVADGLILSLAGKAAGLYAGTDHDLLLSNDEGQSWQSMPPPPLHDLKQLRINHHRLWVIGLHSSPIFYEPDQGWQARPEVPSPLLNLSPTPDGALIAADLTGLSRSTDEGLTWQSVIETPGQFSHVTFRADGCGWAGSADGAYLLRTCDHGQTWQPLPSPFGVLPLAALRALPTTLFAATYDPRRQIAQIWRSDNEGETWQRGAEVRTTWPVVVTHDAPSLLTLGGDIFLEGAEGEWDQIHLGSGGIRRIVGRTEWLLALTTTGLRQSFDGGHTWQPFEIDLPFDQIVDLTLNDKNLYILLAGGRVQTKPIRS